MDHGLSIDQLCEHPQTHLSLQHTNFYRDYPGAVYGYNPTGQTCQALENYLGGGFGRHNIVDRHNRIVIAAFYRHFKPI